MNPRPLNPPARVPANEPGGVGEPLSRPVTRAGLRFEVTHTGPPEAEPVLLLHGFPQCSDSWDALVPALTEAGYRAVTMDQRGYSLAARPRGRRAYRIPELVADVAAVIDDLKAGPVHLVGHDWGAAIAWALTATHPGKVATLTAVSVPHPAAFLSSLLTSTQAIRSWYMFFFQLPWLPEWLLRNHPELATRWLISGGQTLHRACRDTHRLAQPGAAHGPLNYYRAMPLINPRLARTPVRRPTLFIWSDQDIAIGRRAATRCARWVTDAPYQFEILPGVSHWIPEETPDQLAELLLPQLRRHPRLRATAPQPRRIVTASVASPADPPQPEPAGEAIPGADTDDGA